MPMNLKPSLLVLLAAPLLSSQALAGDGQTKTFKRERDVGAFQAAVRASGAQAAPKSGLFQFGSFAPPKKGSGWNPGNGGGQPHCDPPDPFAAPEIDPNLAVAGLLVLIGGSLVLLDRR